MEETISYEEEALRSKTNIVYIKEEEKLISWIGGTQLWKL